MANIVLDARDLRKSYGERQLFEIENLTVYDGERIGLVGTNGAGKSTLLRMLAGEEEADTGTVRRFGDTALIRQEGLPGQESEGVYRALFRAQEQRDSLSGGEQTRSRIAAALSAHPRLLLADEPTTDLDEEGLRLLRQQLESFRGTLILVSHDRALLRRLCTRIWCLENGKITDFPGGYDDFVAEKSRQRERAQFEYDQYRAEKKRLKESAQRMTEWASSVKKAPSRMGNSEARLHTHEYTNSVLHLSHAKHTLQKRMDMLEVKEKPTALPNIRMQLGVSSPIGAKTALEAHCDRLMAGGQVLLQNADFTLPTGSRTALMGLNGCGKTTLLSALCDQLPAEAAFSGTLRFNPQARLGWFDQHHERTLRQDCTVLENVMESSVHPQTLARTVLSCLGFAREDAFKPVSVLSGGEKAKVALARLLLMDLNLLLLDEPTNHLDLFTLEALEDLLSGYGGTLLFVSHDETFVRKVATRVLRFENRRLVALEGQGETRPNPAPNAAQQQEHQLHITRLEMRLADLATRLSQPKKGDHPDQLNEEYLSLAEELRLLKQGTSSTK